MKLAHAIVMITGKLGCGKSFVATKITIEQYIAQGKPVYMNYDLKGEWWNVAFERRFSGLFSRAKDGLDQVTGRAEEMPNPLEWRNNVYRFENQEEMYDVVVPGDYKKEDRGLLVMDEMGLRANARAYTDRRKANKDMFNGQGEKDVEFFVNMRKKGLTCLIIGQDAKMIDAQLREVVGAELQLTNLRRSMIPVVGIPLSKRDRFVWVLVGMHHRDWQGAGTFGGNKRIFNSYETMQEFKLRDERETGVRLMSPPESVAKPVETFEAWERRTRAERAIARARGAALLPGMGRTGLAKGRTVLVTPSDTTTGGRDAG